MTDFSLQVAACRYAAALSLRASGSSTVSDADVERACADLERAAISHADRAGKTKQRGATKAQLAHRAKLFGSASPSIHDDVSSLKGE